jgi:diguanylate cyclase (GGDEF)-like protein/PAS domain S-box-containing protein
MRAHAPIVGIIAKSLEGPFNGMIMAGITHALKMHNCRAIAIQVPWSPTYPLYQYPIGMDQVDGWLIINETVTPEFLRMSHERGLPVVSINREEKSIPCASVLIDNTQGMYIATRHLIEHGHRRIAFMGDLTNPNIRKRMDGYKQALEEFGLATAPDLIVNTLTSAHKGSFIAADALIDKLDTFTAYVGANDLITMGFTEALQEKGLRVPEDKAAVGMNNDPNSMVSGLTTVQIPSFELGSTAVETLLRKLGGEAIREEQIIVPCTLVIRRSCGCTSEACIEHSAPQNSGSDSMDLVTESKFLLQMMDQYRGIAFTLIRSHQIDLRNLSWMMSMNSASLALWDFEHSDSIRLIMDKHYDHTSQDDSLPGRGYACEQFPPIHPYLTLGGGMFQNDIIYINLIRTERREWGVLTFAGQMRPGETGQRMSITLMSLLVETVSAIMDLDHLLAETKEQKDLFQSMAEQLSTITEATSDGIWVLDIVEDTIDWYNDRIHDILGFRGAVTLNTMTSFMERIHPDDLTLVQETLREHMDGSEPFHIECRMLRSDGSYIWAHMSSKRLSSHGRLRIIGSIRDITASKLAEEQIKFLAYHDPLTSLSNRRAFNETLEKSIEVAHKNQHKLGLILFDLDRFKLINDSYGHPIGDKVLITVAERLSQLIPSDFSFFRLSGDEFIILLPHLQHRDEISSLCRKVIHTLEEPFRYDAIEFHIGASLGACVYPDDGNDMTELVKNADIAMYRAKANGRNQMEWFSSAMDAHNMEWLNIENGLRRALQQGELTLYYQPQIDLKTGELHGAEALLRWNSAERGIVPPLQFIPVAEETGLIVPIGEWVLKEACTQMMRWSKLFKGNRPFVCSVNISGRQFEHHQFADYIRAVLAETGMDPGMLCLEITESMAIRDINFYIRQLNDLIKLGIRIALDDFGTGQSSLDVLRRLPVQYIKIDRSFIQHIETNPDDLAIVDSIITLSHSLRKQVVAEGVEYENQRERLALADCDYFQGYLGSRPVPADQFERMFLNSEA